MLFSPVFISTEPRTMFARYAVLPSLSLASGPQVLPLSKFKAPRNHAESTLLQVFFLKNLKPFGINTCEKQREGAPLWLTSCYEKVSVGKVRWNPSLPSCVHSSEPCRLELLCLPLAGPERSRSDTKTPGCGAIPPFLACPEHRRRVHPEGLVRRELERQLARHYEPPLTAQFPKSKNCPILRNFS